LQLSNPRNPAFARPGTLKFHRHSADKQDMKRSVLKSAILLAAWLGYACSASAQTAGPTATPSSLSFSYTVNSTTLPAAATVKITLPAASASLPLVVAAPDNWAAVTPLGGSAPLTLSVSVNPTGLAPGSYVTSIGVDTNPSSHTPASIAVTLTVSNLPPDLVVTSPQSAPYYTPAGSGSTSPIVTFSYTTGAATNTVPPPATAPACNMELDVSSNGGIIPFNVTVANVKSTGSSGTSPVWVRVNSSGQFPTTATSGVANTGSYAPLCVTADLPTVQTLNPGSYAGQITIAANNSVNGTWVILVDLIVSAGQPVLNSIYPNVIVANPAVNPVLTLYGDNFFNTSVVTLQLGSGTPVGSPGVTTTLLSRTVLQATVSMAYFTPANEGSAYPVAQVGPPAVPAGIPWTVTVNNPATATDPSPQVASEFLYVTDPTLPSISSVVNAASYLSTSVFTGTGTNPNPPGNPYPTTVAPREIISIFGQNLGPSTVTTAIPVNGSGNPSPPPLYYQDLLTYNGTISSVSVSVIFTYTPAPVPPAAVASPTQVNAPIIMFTSNQINAIVPYEVEQVLQTSTQTATMQAIVSTTPVGGLTATAVTPVMTVTVLPEDPGVFTFTGLGQGQAAVLNQDYSINGSKNAAARGSTIQIFATGMGELATPPVQPDGMVATSTPVLLGDQTWRVDIGGQPAVVTYAGTSPGSIDGLVQINAIIPPTVGTGSAISIAASIGSPTASHRTQAGATISVK
jgi:uncharacterized protein (TIGR03437 family)